MRVVTTRRPFPEPAASAILNERHSPKDAAGRARDEADIVELVRANPDAVETVRRHLESVHPDYVTAFDALVTRAQEQQDV